MIPIILFGKGHISFFFNYLPVTATILTILMLLTILTLLTNERVYSTMHYHSL